MVVAPLPALDWKAIFRQRAKAARKAAAKSQPRAAHFAGAAFRDGVALAPEAKVAIYHPKGDELDTWPLAEGLMHDGFAVLLPRIVERGQPLAFHLFEVDRDLVKGPHGIMEPPSDAPTHRPDVVICPLLGFRPDGARLGYGGGYYDRTLKALRAEGEVLAYGFGYAGQVMDRFPVNAHDEFLDGFVSEQGLTKVQRRR